MVPAAIPILFLPFREGSGLNSDEERGQPNAGRAGLDAIISKTLRCVSPRYLQRTSLPVGTWLSLVEHSLGVRGVGSSNLPVPTNSQFLHVRRSDQTVSCCSIPRCVPSLMWPKCGRRSTAPSLPTIPQVVRCDRVQRHTRFCPLTCALFGRRIPSESPLRRAVSTLSESAAPPEAKMGVHPDLVTHPS